MPIVWESLNLFFKTTTSKSTNQLWTLLILFRDVFVKKEDMDLFIELVKLITNLSKAWINF
jgi:hypothetical protein